MVGTGVEVGVGVAVGVGVVLSVGCDAAQAVLAEERALVAALDRVVAYALALSTAFVSALKSMSLVFPRWTRHPQTRCPTRKYPTIRSWTSSHSSG